MREEPKTLIQDIETLKEFIKLDKRKSDYYNHIVEKMAMRKLKTPASIQKTPVKKIVTKKRVTARSRTTNKIKRSPNKRIKRVKRSAKKRSARRRR